MVVTRKIVVSRAAFVLVAAIAVVVVGIRAVQLFLRHLLVVRFSKILLAVI